ncbi:uncharacterized protein VP01_11293g1, partial [Puccinia sorghi]
NVSHPLTQPQPPSLFLQQSCHPSTPHANPWALHEANHSHTSSSGSGQPSDTMDAPNSCLDELMCMMAKEPGQQTPLSTKSCSFSYLQYYGSYQTPTHGTRGAAAKVFVKIGLHAITYPKRFPTNISKVVFAVLFMKDYTATWTRSSMGNQWSLMTSSII